MPPVHRILGAERRLVHLGRGWNGRDAAEHHLAQAKRIGRAKHAPHVVHTPHIVEHDGERELGRRAKIGYTETTHFIDFQFFVHAAKVNFSCEINHLLPVWKNSWKMHRKPREEPLYKSPPQRKRERRGRKTVFRALYTEKVPFPTDFSRKKSRQLLLKSSGLYAKSRGLSPHNPQAIYITTAFFSD